MMKWMVDARTVVLLGILGALAILLASGSAIYGYRVHQKARQVNAVFDSLSAVRCVPQR